MSLLKSIHVVALLGFFLMVVIAASGCGGLIGLHAAQNPPLNQVALMGVDSTSKLSVPFELKASSKIDVPSDMMKYTKGQESYQGYNKFMGMEVITFCYEEKILPIDWKPSLEGAAEGDINGIAKASSITNFARGMSWGRGW